MKGGRDVLIRRFPVCAMEKLVGLEGGHHVREVHLCRNVASEPFFDLNKLFFGCCLKWVRAEFKTEAQKGLEEQWRCEVSTQVVACGIGGTGGKSEQ